MRRRAVSNYDLQVRERTQTEHTSHRRADRSRRRRMFAFGAALFCGLLVASAPSLVSVSPLGRSLLTQAVAGYGWDAEIDSVQLGWVTPVRIVGLHLTGNRAGSTVSVGEVQTGLTFTQLFSSELSRGRFGEVLLRDVHVGCSVQSGSSSIETDLTDLLAPSNPPSTVSPAGSVQIQGLHIDVTDMVTKSTWSLKQSNATAQIDAKELTSKWQGVLSQPGGGEGSLQGEAVVGWASESTIPVAFQLDADSLPVSVLSLVARRFPDSQLPSAITGDLSGSAHVDMPESGLPRVSLRKIELRGLAAMDPGTGKRLWGNELTQLDGDWIWQPGRIVAREVTARTDFANVALNGTFADSISFAGAGSNPLAWLDQVDATADVQIDLPRLQAAMPRALPLRRNATLHRGIVHATIEPVESNATLDGTRRRRLVIHSDTIEATSEGKSVVIAPMAATAIVASDATTLSAEQFELNSPFAQINGHGNIASGAAELKVNFGKLAQMLQPLFEVDQQDLRGDVVATLRWDAEAGGLWRLRGNSRIDNLMVQFDPERRLKQTQLISALDVEGKWSTSKGSWSLDELSRGSLQIEGDGVNTDVDLVQAVPNPDRTRLLPLRVRGRGRIESIAEMFRPWIPNSVANVRGGFDISARTSLSIAGEALVQSVTGQFSSLEVPIGENKLRQEMLKLNFAGQAMWPRQEVTIDSLTITGDALSAAVKGNWVNNMTDLEIAWRADLERLQTSDVNRVASRSADNVRAVGFNNNAAAAANGQWSVAGKLEGNTVIVGDRVTLQCDTKLVGRDVKLREPVPGMNPPQTSLVWSEPLVEVTGKFAVQVPTMAIRTDSLQVSTDWCGVTLAGAASWKDGVADVQLSGPARFKMDKVARHLTRVTGVNMVAEGEHQTPLEILYAQNNSKQYAFTVKGSLGWESVDTAGMLFGSAEVPFRMTESVVTIAPSRIPVLGPSRLTPQMIGPQVPPLSDQPRKQSTGEIMLAGDVHYRPELYIEMRPGPIARNVELTPDMTGKWLKYMAPIASDAARVEGSFSADLEHAVVWIDQPRRSEVQGRLDIERVQMNAGPLADQVIAGARQLQALAAIGSAAQTPQTGRTLITLPAQSVKFNVSQGVVTHRAIMMDIDRARVITSGQVDFDGRLDLIAQIPLDAKWLGSDLRGLAGQTMTLPINGTLSRPSLDSAGIRRVALDMGTQAAQDAAGNYLQQQLGRGQQQLEQGISKGLEKLRFDKLFGN